MIDGKLHEVLRKHLPAAPADAPLEPDDNLTELGLDSLRLVEFIIDLEEEFQIVIPDEAMVVDNFRTVGAVNALVEQLLSVRS